MITKFVIIGGGVAGLCSAIRLSELGEEPLLIEGGSFPAHKVCGEFLSPECIHYLEDWNIHPECISEVVINTQSNHLNFSLTPNAGGMSHIKLDPCLVKYALSIGSIIKTNIQVTSFKPKKNVNDTHLIELSNGETIQAKNLIIAAGRFSNYLGSPPTMVYKGFKAHFENIPVEPKSLQMFSFSGAYLGISPIEDNKFNIACLAEVTAVKNQDPHLFMQRLLTQNSFLNSLLSQSKNLFDEWMTASMPKFGIKQTPDWPDTYFIGDAAISIPPACGNGLSMAIYGGRLAAEYSQREKFQDFKKIWIKRCSSQLFWAKALHKLMLNPNYGESVLLMSQYFPYIAKKFFEFTRHPSSIGQ